MEKQKQNKNTVPKVPLFLRLIAWLFPKVEAVSPYLANRWAMRLFLTPYRYPVPAEESAMEAKAEKFRIRHEGKAIQVYAWGEGDKVIIVVHGWSGRGTQFYRFVPLLVEAGYKVVAFDGPAHHRSQGKQTSVPEFAAVIKTIVELYGGAEAMISHSLGGVACLYALREGLRVRRLVSICTPAIGKDILKGFLNKINASPKVGFFFNDEIRKRFGVDFDQLSGANLVKGISSVDYLIAHDVNDAEVPISHAEALASAYPKGQLYTPRSDGHTRVLRDAQVVQYCSDFVIKEKRGKEEKETFAPV